MRWGIVLLILATTLSPFFSNNAHAELVAVTASVQPPVVAPSSTEIFSVELTSLPENSGSIVWVSVVRPSANFTVRAGTLPGWQTESLTAERVTFLGDIISPNQTVTMTVIAQAANVAAPAAQWTVEVSENADGSSPLSYSSEDMATAIVGTPTDNSPPIISNISITKLTTSSATISWSTDEPATSRIDYGTSSSYTSTRQAAGLNTSHSFTLSGLIADTTYHYQLTNTDALGNAATFGDNTFVTREVLVSAPVEAVRDTGERVPPTAQLTTVVGGSYQQAPKFSGTARDNEAIARVDYSLDGGISWRRVTEVTGVNTARVSFTFQPTELEDGNYTVIARAVDPSGNVGQTAPQTLVIDLGPPVVGIPTIVLGARSQLPNQSGFISLPVAAKESITVAAVGGPIEVKLLAERISDSGKVGRQYSLTRSQQTGLWRGELSFAETGLYRLRSSAIDGAGNVAERVVSMVDVVRPVSLSIGGVPAKNSEVTVYIRERFTNDWVLWDGAPYGQQNPRKVGDGTFPLALPHGTYYISVRGEGHSLSNSQVFSVDVFTNLTGTMDLKPTPRISVGKLRLTLRWPIARQAPITFSTVTDQTRPHDSLIGKPLANFSLPTTGAAPIRTVDLLGKPTVVTLLNSWSPDSVDQLAILDTLAGQPTVGVTPVVMHESVERARTIGVQGGYRSVLAVDRDGQLLTSIPAYATPTHIIVSRRGTIKRVVVGVLSKEMIMSMLANSDQAQ